MTGHQIKEGAEVASNMLDRTPFLGVLVLLVVILVVVFMVALWKGATLFKDLIEKRDAMHVEAAEKRDSRFELALVRRDEADAKSRDRLAVALDSMTGELQGLHRLMLRHDEESRRGRAREGD